MPNKSLTEILQDLYDCGIGHGKGLAYVYHPSKEAKSAILTLFRGLVPEEGELYGKPAIELRDAILESLDKLEKEGS